MPNKFWKILKITLSISIASIVVAVLCAIYGAIRIPTGSDIHITETIYTPVIAFGSGGIDSRSFIIEKILGNSAIQINNYGTIYISNQKYNEIDSSCGSKGCIVNKTISVDIRVRRLKFVPGYTIANVNCYKIVSDESNFRK